MDNNLPPSSTPLWLQNARQLAEQIDNLQTVTASASYATLNEDLQKLHVIGRRLVDFTQSISRGITINHRLVKHELRNLISAAIGYSEFILEDIDLTNDNVLHDSLQNILQLCHSVSNYDSDEQPSAYSSGTVRKTANLATNNENSVSTILIVDDQIEGRDILRRYLQQSNVNVLEADSGQSMFSVLAEHEVDLLLLDLILPEMDGDELLQLLKQDEKLRAIPVIVISGSKETDRVIRCIEAGAEDYLFKPFNPVLLRARIRAGLERKRWHNKEQHYRRELERNEQFIRQVFGRYLSDEIVTSILEKPEGLDLGGSQRKVTVLMADISGFSTIAEQLSPPRVVRLLNNYLGVMSDIVMQYGGTVDEFIGDAILAIFGAPTANEDDSDRAVQTAIAMQQAMNAINQLNKKDQLPDITMGVSIHTGQVVAGNIGSEKRAKYGVVGHTVNQTARIGSHCQPGEVLISAATLNDCQFSLAVGACQSIQAKGILQAIEIYKLEGLNINAAADSGHAQSAPKVTG